MKQRLQFLGKRIAELRTKKGLTQENLAEIIDYSPNHISKLESARTNPSFELLCKVADALNVEIFELFNFNEYKSEKFILKEFENLINNKDFDKLKLLYKFYRSVEL